MEYEKPSHTADFIFIKSADFFYVLLIKRKNDPFKGKWALPGGFLDKGETVKQAAVRELKEETGIDCLEPKLLGVYSKPGRDPRGWVVSTAFIKIVKQQKDIKAGDDASEAKWFDLNNLPELAFDHIEILNDAKDYLKKVSQNIINLIDGFDKDITLADISSLNNIIQ